MGEAESGDGLLMAFNAVLSTVSPERRELVLRHSIRLLLEDRKPSPTRPLPAPRSPAITTMDTEAWAILKTRVRDELKLRQLSLGDLAAATGIPRSTLEKTLSPKGVTPGRLVAEKLEAWLATQSSKSSPAISATAETAKVPARMSDDRIGSNGADHRVDQLNIEQPERLAGCVSMMDRRELHAATGIGEDVIAQAISGESLDAATVTRLAGFLDEAAPV